MNFAGILMRFLFVTFVCLSAIKTAHIPEEEGQRAHEVLSFLEVYNRSVCRPREVLVDVLAEYPDEVEYLFIPSCVALTRCAGCCPDEALECTPVVTHNVTLQVKRVRPLRQKTNSYMSFTEHSMCECRQKIEMKEKVERKQRRGKGKGLKRKRKKKQQGKQEASTPVCEPCCSGCSERRRRLFVQDPQTCHCSCKNTEADCWARRLELNERTCRCDKPRR
ncbi:vascular endothelial growth factor Ab isoform X1 [Clupea harengus]|uniref:Vascular endothelial growth factor Ab isoform X1 n=1 Tax=Clupea harengus TaxID=7950 RepID=A0A6P3VWH2_CLUHA|nr:vascular endothelial growth factor Ab isoform X1 [Clupea harengus]